MKRRSVLVIADPAVGMANGHHMSFLETVVAADLEAHGISEVVLAVQVTRNWRTAELRLPGGVEIWHHFQSNLYSISKSSTSTAITLFIDGLADEYADLMSRLIARYPDLDIIMLHHTMDWVHIRALDLGLARGAAGAAIVRHVVFLMFFPGIDCFDEIYDKRAVVQYKRALARLERRDNVDVFASCQEIARTAAALCQRSAPFPIHPCIVGISDQPPARDRAFPKPATGFQQVILFLGDPREDKGFLRTPEKIERWRSRLKHQGRIILHHTPPSVWSLREILDTVNRIEEIARVERQLHYVCGIVDNLQIENWMKDADLLVLDYDLDVYRHATSGPLWLAGKYGTPVSLEGESWLKLEAGRLGLKILDLDGRDLSFNEESPIGDKSYFSLLYDSPWRWLPEQERSVVGRSIPTNSDRSSDRAAS